MFEPKATAPHLDSTQKAKILAPESGLKSDIAGGPFRATSRHQFDFDGEDSRTL